MVGRRREYRRRAYEAIDNRIASCRGFSAFSLTPRRKTAVCQILARLGKIKWPVATLTLAFSPMCAPTQKISIASNPDIFRTVSRCLVAKTRGYSDDKREIHVKIVRAAPLRFVFPLPPMSYTEVGYVARGRSALSYPRQFIPARINLAKKAASLLL